jgi:CubicO group peptidase (beta-lactamase class C family)
MLDYQDFENFCDDFFLERMKKYHIPGAALGLVQNGELLFSKGYGYADLERQIPVRPNKTIFRVGSVSKVFTATAIMQLVEQKKLKLDDDINQYLEDFQLPNTYSEPITLANLLTHTDGFDFGWGIGVFGRSSSELMPLSEFLKQNLPPRLFPPGEMYLYGNVGMTLAGLVIETISGVSFSQHLDKQLLKPLQMTRSTFEQPLPPLLANDLAIGYQYQKGKLLPRPFAYFKSPPAGAFSTTVTDMAQFMIAHLQNGQYQQTRILQKNTVAEMHRQQFTSHPLIAGAAYGFYERFRNGQRILEHNGRLNGYNSLLFLLPQYNLGCFLCCNTNGGQLVNQFIQAFFDRYYPETNTTKFSVFPEERPTFSPSALSGIYRLNQYSHTSIDKLGVLLGQAPEIRIIANKDATLTLSSKPEIKWSEISPLLFQSNDQKHYLSFRRIKNRLYLFLDNWAYFTFEKLAWYEPIKFQIKVIIPCLLIFLLNLGSNLWQLPVIFLNHQSEQIFLQALGAGVSFLNIIFFIGVLFTLVVSDFWSILFGLSRPIKMIFSLPKISTILGAILVVLVIFFWLLNYNFSLILFWYSLIAVAEIIFIFYFNYWKLIKIKSQ